MRGAAGQGRVGPEQDHGAVRALGQRSAALQVEQELALVEQAAL